MHRYKLLNVSKVHGNSTAECTQINAIRLLEAFAPHTNIDVYPGATRPLLRPSRADPGIHGADGLGGVEGLPSLEHDGVQRRLARSKPLKAIEGIANAVSSVLKDGKKLNLIACGPLTNIALFVCVYPELLSGIEQICFMGGGKPLANASVYLNVLICRYRSWHRKPRRCSW